MNITDIITHLIGNEYCCRTTNGDTFYITFIDLSTCKDSNGNSAVMSLEAGAIILKWISGPFKKTSIRTTIGYTRIHGNCDGVINFIGAQKNIIFNANSESDLRISDYSGALSKISLVVSAYNLDYKINDFMQWNDKLFSKIKNLEVVVVLDPNSNFQTGNPIYTILKYPKKQTIFSIGKTINFGIRNTQNTPNRIIIKTDIDIVFTNSVLNYVLYNVNNNIGMVALPAYIERNFDINTLENPGYWNRQRKVTDARGACFALTREDWFNLNGYDERIEGWGGDDTEMWFRANKKLKFMKVTTHHPIYHIEHPIRINQNGFIFNSGRNVEIGKNMDWKSERWGMIYD